MQRLLKGLQEGSEGSMQMCNRRYRCIHCGELFELSNEEQRLLEQGFITYTPKTCDECYEMLLNNVPDEILSDSDSGL